MRHLGTRVLHTERLTLRPFTVDDAEAMFAGWANDPEVTKYLTWTPHDNIEVTRALLSLWQEEAKRPETYNWAIVRRGDAGDELIGNISLLAVDEHHEQAELGYCMARKYWGKGIMTEALREVLRYAFVEVGFYRITGRHAAQNIGSARVQEKGGLRYEGTMREAFRLYSTGERADIVVRGILRKDFLVEARS